MKKTLAIVLIALLALTSVFANGTKEETSSGKTEIVFWSFPTLGNDGHAEEALIKAFEAENPDVKVRLELIDFQSGPQKLTAAIEGGAAPDVLLDAPGRIIEYGTNGKLVSFDDMFTEEMKADVGNEGLLDACSDGTTYWMYPLSSAPFYMGINKEMWQEVGAWEYVNPEGERLWTTDDFIKAMDCFAEAGKVGINVYCGGQGGDQGTRALVNNLYGSSILDADGNWSATSPEMKKALQTLVDLYNEGGIDFGRGIAAGDEIQLFKLQQIGSTICWGTSNAKNNATDKYTQFSVPFPSNDGIPELEFLLNGFCIFDNKSEARADAAKRFVAFVCDDPEWGLYAVRESAAFPVRQSFGNPYEGNAEYELLNSWTKYYGPYYNTKPNFAAMRTQWWNMLQFVSTGAKTVDQATADFNKALNQ